MDMVNRLIQIAKGISQSLGETCEAVVHDRDHRIAYIANGHISGREQGQEMEESVFKYFEDETRANNGTVVRARTVNQQRLVRLYDADDLLFAVGPAGSGKTYTAIALAVRALKEKHVKRIILTRPAVEAGEKLGFLPGDMKEKLDPYLQPLYDALNDMIPPAKLQKYIEEGTVQIAPLAYMRGRTLDDSFIILDEAQNTTREQMKMFLTRLGFHSKVVVTGDITQTDLPYGKKSGLAEAIEILKDIPEIGMVHLTHKDVVRHELVQTIVKAYDAYYHREAEGQRP